MKRGRVLGLVLLVLYTTLVSAVPSRLQYQMGQQYVFAVNGVVDAKGQDVTNNERTPGSAGTLTSTMVMEPVKQDSTSYLFVMNMFNTQVDVEQQVGVEAPTDGDPLGDDMYFQQTFDGKITQIWYSTDDSPYYVNIKVASINSFQTSIVGVGATKVVLESDPIGVHNAKVAGAAGSSVSLVVNKEFTQTDFSKFSDPSLTSKNVNIAAKSSVGVHEQGYILSTSVTQLSVLTDINSPARNRRGLTNSTGFDMDLSSLGTLTHSLGKIMLASAGYALKPVMNASAYIQDTLFGVSSKMSALALTESHSFANVEEKLAAVFQEETFTSTMVNTLYKIGNHFRYFPADIPLLSPHLKQQVFENRVQSDKLFYLLGVAQREDLLIEYGLKSETVEVRNRAIIACASLTLPTYSVMFELYGLTQFKSNLIAAHVFGILAGRLNEPKFNEIITSALNDALHLDDLAGTVAWINAAGNAGPNSVSFAAFRSIVLSHPNPIVREAAVYALRKFTSLKAAIQLLREVYATERDVSVLKTCVKLLNSVEGEGEVALTVSDSDFPFNKSISEAIKLGDKIVNANFDVELFAGTNFNCKQPNFNYKALASATADVSLFGKSKQAFYAGAVYGAENGQALSDDVTLSVWGDVIYHKSIPHVDCSPHSYPLAHTAPGFSISHTIWVSIVPVVFTAAVSLQLDLSWGWQVCDAQLAATIDIVPTGSLVISGSITVDLLLLRAGFELDASFNEKIIPSLYIHGSECELGFNVEEDANAMTGKFDGYFQWRECKFLFFDCHWGTHNEKDFWTWSRPATKRSLFNTAWKIAK